MYEFSLDVEAILNIDAVPASFSEKAGTLMGAAVEPCEIVVTVTNQRAPIPSIDAIAFRPYPVRSRSALQSIASSTAKPTNMKI